MFLRRFKRPDSDYVALVRAYLDLNEMVTSFTRGMEAHLKDGDDNRSIVSVQELEEGRKLIRSRLTRKMG